MPVDIHICRRTMLFGLIAFPMWPFSKKWSPPEPRLTMVLSLGSQKLPPIVLLANPTGADGAAQGMAGPADGKTTPENMMKPMTEGDYVAISSAGGGCALRVERVEPCSCRRKEAGP